MSLLGGENIIGSQALRARLYSDIKSGSLAHAYIIEGKPGSGRHTLAKNIIAALSCLNDGDALPCGTCHNCKHIFEDKCPDVMYVSRGDKASLGIEPIREMRSSLLTVPNDLELKHFIIEDADTMTVQAQNALLLTLEQPPSFVSFFIICENARTLLETIRSRAPILRVEHIAKDRIDKFLTSDKADKSIRDAATALKRGEPNEYETVLMASDGSIGRAISLLSPKKRKPISDRRLLVSYVIERLCGKAGERLILTLLPEFPQKRDELVTQLEDLKWALRDLILLKKSEDAPLCFYADRETALDISSMIPKRKLISAFDQTSIAVDSLLKNANVRLTMIGLLSNL